jgi:hypothetical protein
MRMGFRGMRNSSAFEVAHKSIIASKYLFKARMKQYWRLDIRDAAP